MNVRTTDTFRSTGQRCMAHTAHYCWRASNLTPTHTRVDINFQTPLSTYIAYSQDSATLTRCVMHDESVCNDLLHQDNCLNRLVFWNVKPYQWYVGIMGLEKSAASSIRAEVGSVVTKSSLHISCNSSTTYSPCNAGSLPVRNNMLCYHRSQTVHTDRNSNLKRSKRVSR